MKLLIIFGLCLLSSVAMAQEEKYYLQGDRNPNVPAPLEFNSGKVLGPLYRYQAITDGKYPHITPDVSQDFGTAGTVNSPGAQTLYDLNVPAKK